MNVIITGASRGIGYALVKKFAQESGHTIYAVSRNKERLERLNKECKQQFSGSEVKISATDLASESALQNFGNQIKANDHQIDIIINNAGSLVNKPFDALTGNDFDRVFEVNVKSVFRMIQLVKPRMKPGSHIVNISSMGGYQGSAKFPGLSLYSASKGAVAVLTECLAEEFKNDGISVNCLALGAVQTEMLSEAFPGYEAPLNAQEMANYIFQFATNGQKIYNGKILPVSLSTP